jgi:hypothetical protein
MHVSGEIDCQRPWRSETFLGERALRDCKHRPGKEGVVQGAIQEVQPLSGREEQGEAFRRNIGQGVQLRGGSNLCQTMRLRGTNGGCLQLPERLCNLLSECRRGGEEHLGAHAHGKATYNDSLCLIWSI